MALRKHYLLANIGDQYMRLNWKLDYWGSDELKESVEAYLAKWYHFKMSGMGMEFGSRKTGTGKTFAATHIGKELIKRGESVYFIDFIAVINSLSTPDKDLIDMRMRRTTLVILDDVRSAVSSAQRQFFGGRLEEIIRHRTNFNLPTIITTNLSKDDLDEEYPRTYSLLEAKQLRVDVNGDDSREKVGARDINMVGEEETRPIT